MNVYIHPPLSHSHFIGAYKIQNKLLYNTFIHGWFSVFLQQWKLLTTWNLQQKKMLYTDHCIKKKKGGGGFLTFLTDLVSLDKPFTASQLMVDAPSCWGKIGRELQNECTITGWATMCNRCHITHNVNSFFSIKAFFPTGTERSRIFKSSLDPDLLQDLWTAEITPKIILYDLSDMIYTLILCFLSSKSSQRELQPRPCSCYSPLPSVQRGIQIIHLSVFWCLELTFVGQVSFLKVFLFTGRSLPWHEDVSSGDELISSTANFKKTISITSACNFSFENSVEQ